MEMEMEEEGTAVEDAASKEVWVASVLVRLSVLVLL